MTRRLFLIFAAIFSLVPPAAAATTTVRTNFGGTLSKKVVSVREMRFKEVVPQRYDFSCGAASLATLFKYTFGIEEADEEEIVKEMIEKGDRERIRENGFSLLDMKRHAERRGFQANGYRVQAENLPRLNIPVIALIHSKGYKHFVILKGIRDKKAYLADPASGNRAIPLETFVKSWDGVIFVVYKKTNRNLTPTFDETLKGPADQVLHLQEQGMIRNDIIPFIPLPGEF